MSSLKDKIFEACAENKVGSYWSSNFITDSEKQGLVEACRTEYEATRALKRQLSETFWGDFWESALAVTVAVIGVMIILLIIRISLHVLRVEKGENRLIRSLWQVVFFEFIVVAFLYCIPVVTGIIARGYVWAGGDVHSAVINERISHMMIPSAPCLVLLCYFLMVTEDNKKDVMLVGGEPFDPDKEEAEVEPTAP